MHGLYPQKEGYSQHSNQGRIVDKIAPNQISKRGVNFLVCQGGKKIGWELSRTVKIGPNVAGELWHKFREKFGTNPVKFQGKLRARVRGLVKPAEKPPLHRFGPGVCKILSSDRFFWP